MLQSKYIQCKKCVLDTTAKYLTFDKNGICDYCNGYERVAKKFILIPKEEKDKILSQNLKAIKITGKNKKYDCILGLSGGVDSTYMAYKAIEFGLKPLAVHFDNGWNSDAAVENIKNICQKLNLDLHTYVINWEDFKDIQLAYFKASVVDLEVPTDQFIFGALYNIAIKFNIKYILSGYNIVTEYGMPQGWNYNNKFDKKNVIAIHKEFGIKKNVQFPKIGFFDRFYYEKIKGINTVTLLNYINYNKKEVKEFIKIHLNWKDYGGKHHESIFTRFYQDYILPKKFNIDKRKLHLSTLINSNQITKEEALQELTQEPYPIALQESDKHYFIKKLEITEIDFNNIMQKKEVPHSHFDNENNYKAWYTLFNRITQPISKVFLIYRVIKNKLK